MEAKYSRERDHEYISKSSNLEQGYQSSCEDSDPGDVPRRGSTSSVVKVRQDRTVFFKLVRARAMAAGRDSPLNDETSCTEREAKEEQREFRWVISSI